MRTSCKRLLTLILAVAMLVGLLPTVALATESHAGNISPEPQKLIPSNYEPDPKFTEFIKSLVGKLRFGVLHSHTAEYSDGAGTLDAAYSYAQKAEDMDFLFVTDHSQYFDTPSTATTSSYYDLSSLSVVGNRTKWEAARATALSYNTEDFIAGYGFEMSWAGGPGHISTFNTYGPVSRNNTELNTKTDLACYNLYNDLMVNANLGLDVDGNPVAEGVKTKYLDYAPVVSQLNEPSAMGNFNDFSGYSSYRDTVINLIEVGNGEDPVGGTYYYAAYDQYDLALSKGWHVAPTNNQNNHKGKWGDANTARTVIFSNSFNEGSLYTAMSMRRAYSTEDQNLKIFYTLNEQFMGSVIRTDRKNPVEKVQIYTYLSDPDGEALGKIEVIGENGETLYLTEVGVSEHELCVELPNTDKYYYIRVTQADGEIAVTAPVWVDEDISVYGEVVSDKTLHLVLQKEQITTTLTNQADADFTLTRVELHAKVDDEGTHLVNYYDVEETLAPGESTEIPLNYIPLEAEKVELTARIFGSFIGEYISFDLSMEFRAYHPDEIVKIGVDYGHDNLYTSGSYGGNAEGLVQACAENGILCEKILGGEFTAETLSKYDLLILTVPYLRDDKATTYTEEELEALKTFTEKGGSVIITSNSDRRNTYDSCAEISNALLETVGAHSRVVKGIVVDNELKSLEAYRIYLSSIDNFNTEHPFTKGAYTASNAFATIPSEDNQTGFSLYDAAPIEILEGYEDTVEVLLKGYDSTWGSHYDGYFTSAYFTPEYDESNEQAVSVKMGEVDLMTYEELPGGGWVMTSGTGFFNDYNIREKDGYANRFILLNILRELNEKKFGPEEVTPIPQVKEKTEGEFTVDGYIVSRSTDCERESGMTGCVYVADKEGNTIRVYPVDGKYAVGMNVRCHGTVEIVNGEAVLHLDAKKDGKIRVLSDELFYICIHTWDEGVVVTPATCEEEGLAIYTCTHCGETENRVIPATGHDYVITESTAPQCLWTGANVHTCTACGHSYVEVLPALGHSYDEGVVTSPATCTKAGIRTYTCKTCGDTVTETIPAFGHSFDEGAVTQEPACGIPGAFTYTCEHCGMTRSEELPAKTHLYILYADKGLEHSVKCLYCSSSYTEAHDFRTGDCVCGATESGLPTVLEDLQIYHNLNLAGDIAINYMIPAKDLEGCEDFYMECLVPDYEGNKLVKTSAVRLTGEQRGDYYYFVLDGLVSFEMNNEVQAQLVMRRDGKTYLSKTDRYSIATYAYSQLKGENKPEALKTVCANLLQYGAKAQLWKEYRTDALADAGMTEEHRSYLTAPESVTFGNNKRVLGDLADPKVSFAGMGLRLDSKIVVRYVVDLSNYAGDPQTLSLRITYKGTDGTTETAILTELESYSPSKNYYAFSFDGLLAAELRTLTSAAVYEGDTRISETMEYSADTYGNGRTGTVLTVVQAMIAYSDSAKAYFVA